MATILSPPKRSLSEYKGAVKDGKDRDSILSASTTFYVGNLSFYTSEEQLYAVFSKAGRVKKIIMGLDRYKKTPCGFCFVEYFKRSDAEECMASLNGSIVDDRPIRLDWDVGFSEERRFGRGKSGGQIRDEFRLESEYDEGRGGYGKMKMADSSNYSSPNEREDRRSHHPLHGGRQRRSHFHPYERGQCSSCRECSDVSFGDIE